MHARHECYCNMNVTFILCATEMYHVTMATGVSMHMWDHIMYLHAYMHKDYMSTYIPCTVNV